MYQRVWIILILLPLASVHPQRSCQTDFIGIEKNIRKIYSMLHKVNSHCHLPPHQYLAFGKRAYVSKEYRISLWSLQRAIQSLKHPGKSENAEYYYFLGLAYLSDNRLEDAINTLRKVVFHEEYQKIDQKVLQKSHMALLQGYYNRKKSHDQNVKYLIELFKNRYKDSPYLYSIRSWNTLKYSTN